MYFNSSRKYNLRITLQRFDKSFRISHIGK